MSEQQRRAAVAGPLALAALAAVAGAPARAETLLEAAGARTGSMESRHAPADQAARRSEDLLVHNGDVALAATLLLPQGLPPHPALVMLPGSGPHTREDARPYAERMAAAGFAVLSYDKRGSGASGGDWTSASLEDLARDGLAAMRALSVRADIDGARIGLWAASQGAWAASLLSTLTGDVAFLIVVSGGGVTPREAETWSYERELERLGASEPEAAEARALLDAYFAYMGTGAGRAALESRIEAARSQPWYQAIRIHRVLPSDERRTIWEWVATYDPLPAISRMTFPVLLLFGEDDAQQPTRLSIARWEEGLRRAGNGRWVARVLAGAGHTLRRPGRGAAEPEASGDGARPAPEHGGGDREPEGTSAHGGPAGADVLDTAAGWARVQAGLGEVAGVRSFGALQRLMHGGGLEASTSLAEWTPSAGLVAVGALSDLRGEITALEGRVHLSRPAGDESAISTETDASGEGAALLALSEVPSWIEISLAEEIPLEGLDAAIRTMATRAGLNPSRPFAFVVRGTLGGLRFHTIDGARMRAGGGASAHSEAAVRQERDACEATLVGFYSEGHEGVFTHRGSRTHVHVIAADPPESGHVDDVTIRPGAVLRLPAPQ